MQSLSVYFLLMALLVLQRLHEMRLSRRNIAALPPGAQSADPPGNWPLMVFLQVAMLVGAPTEVWLRHAVAPTVIWWPALCVLCLSQLLRFASQRAIGSSWNAQGIVHPDKHVISTGPYRYLRHPNYLAVLLEYIAIPAMGGAWWTLGLLLIPNLAILVRRIRGEEKLLRRSPEWCQEMESKGRLLPRASPLFAVRRPPGRIPRTP